MIPAQTVPKVLVVASLDLHPNHHLNGVTERQRQEEVGLGEFTPEDHDPEQDGRETGFGVQGWIASRERLTGEILPRFARNSVTEHATGRHDRKEECRDDGNKELDDTEDER